MEKLGADSCAQLETLIAGSSERNWQRWLIGKAVPTHTSLSALLAAEITQGSYKDKPLHDVTTNPRHNDLLSLISLT